MQSVRSVTSGKAGDVVSELDQYRTMTQPPDLLSISEDDNPWTGLSGSMIGEDDDGENSTNITVPDSISESYDTDSEVKSLSQSSSPLPRKLNLDERLVKPTDWLNRLGKMVESIVGAFSVSAPLLLSTSPTPSKLGECVQILKTSFTAIKNTEEFKYCTGSINALITNSHRTSVALLLQMEKFQLNQVEEYVQSEDLEGIIQLLRVWSLWQTCQTLESVASKTRTLAAAATAARMSAVATLSYSGAHLEHFEKSFQFSTEGSEIHVGQVWFLDGALCNVWMLTYMGDKPGCLKKLTFFRPHEPMPHYISLARFLTSTVYGAQFG